MSLSAARFAQKKLVVPLVIVGVIIAAIFFIYWFERSSTNAGKDASQEINKILNSSDLRKIFECDSSARRDAQANGYFFPYCDKMLFKILGAPGPGNMIKLKPGESKQLGLVVNSDEKRFNITKKEQVRFVFTPMTEPSLNDKCGEEPISLLSVARNGSEGLALADGVSKGVAYLVINVTAPRGVECVQKFRVKALLSDESGQRNLYLNTFFVRVEKSWFVTLPFHRNLYVVCSVFSR
ncbi:hypothetical protein D6817_04270 [Candidatus Pacearchaeota archaeon]|nr:MAG: hypothetical protein D6817_04270 [Candidatus Pacearchaeota archaeon]